MFCVSALIETVPWIIELYDACTRSTTCYWNAKSIHLL